MVRFFPTIAERGGIMFRPKFRFTHDEVRIIVMALVELKNQLIAEVEAQRLGKISLQINSQADFEEL